MNIEERRFSILDSTNTWAKKNALQLPHDRITLVIADGQTAGRGRFNNSWISPSGLNVYASYCFFLPVHSNISNMAQIMALSAVKALEEVGVRSSLKWPNDILISKKKVGGILCETTALDNEILMIAGIGINVNMPLEMLKEIGQPATSLLIEKGIPFDIQKLIDCLSKQFSNFLTQYLLEGFPPIYSLYREHLIHSPGEKILFRHRDRIWEGLFSSLQQDGSLNLQLASGEIKNFHAGEIINVIN